MAPPDALRLGRGTPDLSSCDREPIHIPGTIQPDGALFVVDPANGRVVQAAVSDPGLSFSRDPLGSRIDELLPPEAKPLLQGLGARLPTSGVSHIGVLRIGGGAYHLIAHQSDGATIVELERTVGAEPGSFDEVYPFVREFLDSLRGTIAIDELSALAAREVRRITGLDRALVYRFDDAWNGEVIAEDRNDVLPSYMDLRFPASDIPAQARELYRKNRLRLIPDANYVPTPITPTLNPLTGRPIDLSFSVLRSVSPVHLEYMRNMETMSSMSISLLRNDRLWGLISCHSAVAARVPYHIRTACDFIGQVLSMQLAAKEASALAEHRNALRHVQTRLLTRMASADNFADGLADNPADLLDLTDAAGAAVVVGEGCRLVGETPSEDQVRALVRWLAENHSEDVFETDSLAAHMDGGAALKDEASGVLAISVSQIHNSYLLWFRPEVIRTVAWGGDPTKRAEIDPSGYRIHPRKSFAAWQETVRLRGRPWFRAEVEAATELRAAIVDVVLRNAEEMAAVSEKLAVINKELEAFSYSVSHDLRAPFRHIVGYSQLLKKFEGERLTEKGNRFVDTIIESAISAGKLVDDLLSFSQMGRATLTPVTIDMNRLIAEVRKRLSVEDSDRNVDWRIADMPSTRADPTMLRLVIQNLLENALKFSRARNPPIIEVDCVEAGESNVYRVRDNGAGFDMAYVGKLFGVFQRLHRIEDFEGTGIGLANVKRIVERHGGRVWAEGKVNEGASIYFSLPNGTAERT